MAHRKHSQRPNQTWRDMLARIPADWPFHVARIPDKVKERIAVLWDDLRRNGSVTRRRERDRHPTYRLRLRREHPERGVIREAIPLPSCAVRGISIVCLAHRIERLRQAEENRRRKRELELEIRQERIWLRVVENALMSDPEFRAEYRARQAEKQRKGEDARVRASPFAEIASRLSVETAKTGTAVRCEELDEAPEAPASSPTCDDVDRPESVCVPSAGRAAMDATEHPKPEEAIPRHARQRAPRPNLEASRVSCRG
jgi:hypothetical protein